MVFHYAEYEFAVLIQYSRSNMATQIFSKFSISGDFHKIWYLWIFTGAAYEFGWLLEFRSQIWIECSKKIPSAKFYGNPLIFRIRKIAIDR